MQCPFCTFDDSRVLDSRTVDAAIRRRRECLGCNARFTTYERVQQASVLIVKKDGRREEFSREKVLIGLRKACEKRPLQAGAIEALVDAVETALLSLGRAEVESTFVGEVVMRELQELDQIAYVRFASVYRSFADIDSMRDALDELERSSSRSRPPREQLPLLAEAELDQLVEAPRVLPLHSGPSSRAGRLRRGG